MAIFGWASDPILHANQSVVQMTESFFTDDYARWVGKSTEGGIIVYAIVGFTRLAT